MNRLFRLGMSILLLALISGCGRRTPFEKLPKIDEALAWNYAEKSVAFGARFSGSEEIARYAQWIRKTAEKSGKFTVTEQRFQADTPRGKVEFRNLIAELPGRSSDWVLIGCHYDAKYFLNTPGFQAANDGASGAAVLLAMIAALEAYPDRPPLTVRFVFFDGEECLYSYGASDGLHGSRELAAVWEKSGQLKNCRAMILLDMIGDRELNLTVPLNSSPGLLGAFDRIVRESFPTLKNSRLPYDMTDDHVPFLERGVPVLDLIDFEYGPGNSNWHTAGDRLENISANSLKTAGDLAFALLWSVPSL